MYPQRQLIRLAAHKVELRAKIARRRDQTGAELARLAQPLAWLNKAAALWRKIPPLVKLVGVPLGLLVIKKTFFRRWKILAPLVRWAPVVYGAVRGIRQPEKSAFR